MTEIFKQDNFLAAAPLIAAGATVVYPTETVYGIGAALANAAALRRIFTLKHRPFNKPLSLNIANVAMARPFISNSDYQIYEKLAQKFLPGPLSVIFRTSYDGPTASYFTNHQTISLRMPANAAFLALLQQVGPMPGTSANLSGELSLTQEKAVIAAMDNLAEVILLAGAGQVGIESTILDLSATPLIRRQGIIEARELAPFFKKAVAILPEQRHYHLKKPVWPYHNQQELRQLIIQSQKQAYFILGKTYDLPGPHLTLEPKTALAHLFKTMKQLNDDSTVSVIFAQITGDNLYSQKIKEMVNYGNKD